MRLRQRGYSQAGNVLFPAWDHFIPKVGLICFPKGSILLSDKCQVLKNNVLLLQDSLTIPDGQYIDNTGEIDYGQLYAQVIHEVEVVKTPYWFDNNEVARIQELNQNYMQQKDIAEIVEICFRKPHEGETAKSMNSKMMLQHIQKDYPSVEINHSNRIKVGLAMKALGYESTDHSNVPFYKVVPIKAA